MVKHRKTILKCIILISIITCYFVFTSHNRPVTQWSDVDENSHWQVYRKYAYYDKCYLSESGKWFFAKSAERKLFSSTGRNWLAKQYAFHDVVKGVILWTLPDDTPSIVDAIIDESNDILWTAHSNGDICKRDLLKGSLFQSVQIRPDDARDEITISLQYSADNESLIVKSRNTWYFESSASPLITYHSRIVVLDCADLNIQHDYSFNDPLQNSFVLQSNNDVDYLMHVIKNRVDDKDRLEWRDLNTNSVLKTFIPVTKGSIIFSELTNDGKKMLANVGGITHIWSTTSGDLINTLPGHLLGYFRIKNKDVVLISNSYKKSVTCFSLDTEGQLTSYELNNQDAVPVGVAYSPEGKFLAVCDSEDTLTLFDTDKQEKVYAHRSRGMWLANAELKELSPLLCIYESEQMHDDTPFGSLTILQPTK